MFIMIKRPKTTTIIRKKRGMLDKCLAHKLNNYSVYINNNYNKNRNRGSLDKLLVHGLAHLD